LEGGPADQSPVEKTPFVQVDQRALDDASILPHPEAGDPLDRVHGLRVAAEVRQHALADFGTRSGGRRPRRLRLRLCPLDRPHRTDLRAPALRGACPRGAFADGRFMGVFSAGWSGATEWRPGAMTEKDIAPVGNPPHAPCHDDSRRGVFGARAGDFPRWMVMDLRRFDRLVEEFTRLR